MALLFLLGCLIAEPQPDRGEEPPPLSADEQSRLKLELDARIKDLTKQIERSPTDLRLRQSRGTAYFFRGRFQEAVADFDKMVEIDPDCEKSHWQRGIALYYDGQFEKSAQQFELYHQYDNVDRENGIWRFLAQSAARGRDVAKKGLLEYSMEDRPPLTDIYAMFSGTLTADQLAKKIERSTGISQAERDKRRFYTDLYIGLDLASQKDSEGALSHLRKAVANPWGQSARGGPGYMWHVARVHWELLERATK
ncbi:MAG: hypothetical protein U1D30_15555 [Planctomycetota bacterium]